MSTFRMRVLGCVLFFGFFFQAGRAQEYYQVDYDNYIEVSREIYLDYQPYFGQRIDTTLLRAHILGQLNARTYDAGLTRPRALCTGKSFQVCLFRWDFLGEPFLVASSYFDFLTGQSGERTVASPGVMLDYSLNQHSLYTFFREMGDGRSSMEIIIVDKDAFSKTAHIPGAAFTNSGILLDVTQAALRPNIVRDISRLVFFTEKEGNVEIQLVELASGRKHSASFSNTRFPAGRNEVEIDLSDLPAGYFQCLLHDGVTYQNIPFVKL